MHLFYLDESGHPTDSNQEYFVLGGFSVFERQGYWFETELDKIAARFNPADPRSVELHGSPMLQGRGFWRGFPVKERIQAIVDSLSILVNSHPGNRAFGSVVKKSAISPKDPVEFCFEQIASRFDQYLWRLHMRKDTQRGIIILDKSTYENTLQGLATDFRSIGHSWGVIRNLAEVPLFLDSKASRLIQLADLIAFGIFRKFEKNDSRFFDLLAKKFDSDGSTTHGFFQKI